LLVVDSNSGFGAAEKELLQQYDHLPALVVMNKSDLGAPSVPDCDCLVSVVSAKNGNGISELESDLSRMLGFTESTEGTFSARQRHVDCLVNTEVHVVAARGWLEAGKRGAVCGEFLAEELRLAQHQLSDVTGEFGADDLLGEIFGSFCIGK